MNKDILIKLRESVEFLDIMKNVREFRPVIPQWHPCTSVDAAQELADSIKLATGEQRGFDLVVAILTGKKEFSDG